MAKSTEKSLVIVESPAKARTIAKFLGDGFQVEASIGHVRDLPSGAKEVPEKFKSEPWAYLGVNVDERFEPVYIVPPEKKKQVTKLKEALKGAKDLYLATDEDREGEAISWHLQQILKPKVPVRRLVFHEITKDAIQHALATPRQIDDGLVRAQETRRILDRLYGYDVSQLLWKKVGRGLSAGRVQSVAVRLIVQRERERIAFHAATYWDLQALFETGAKEPLPATLVSVGDARIPSGKDFDSATGKLKDPSLLQMDELAAASLAERLRTADFQVASVEVKPFTERPKPPFTTSTLQQEANRKLGFTARRTMQAAQKLYENGYITYMRTDSTTLAQVAVDAARDLVRSEYGEQFLHDKPRVYASKVKNAQEAHEAIRPAGHPFKKPEAIRGELDRDQFRLFELIWKRTIASQMADARKKRMTITIEGGGATFQASGTSIEFEGFLRAYVEGSDDPEAELADKETLLPAVAENDPLAVRHLDTKSHTTQPPARYSEASLTRTLEEKGIGRPSTYASIIDTIQNRDYVFKKGNALVPSWTAFSVVRLLEEHLTSLVDYEFTAQMEDFLDSISRQEAEAAKYLQDFYFGDEESSGKALGLRPKLLAKAAEIDARTSAQFPIGTPTEGEHREEIIVRVGKYGPFLEQGERRASLPEGMCPDEVTVETALELLNNSSRDGEPLGTHPETGQPIYVKAGRFGPYVQLGENDDPEKKNQSLLKGMNVNELTLEQAVELLRLPRELGVHPEMQEPVVAKDGRYGPYITCGKETRSLPADLSPLDVTLEQAIELLKQPKTRGRAAAAPKEPLKKFEKPSPVTEKEVKILDGRYGPYVTDGETNASLPKGTEPSGLTFEAALDLLAERAARAPKKKTKKKAAKKAAPKKTATKKATAKKATKTAKKKGVPKKRG
ncbi:type I DNA topoisomerase [Candidatus Laterigemmans baculatus]|uniref:type I DNA topoisomerase n=1 Tax=Candidatus Laterigemmans baculatus TaxID=2770505 RepID=UPI0013DC7F60|nr:type I DNA topoisomerase [Candidatus Laterigemmans baculatus]